jgi:hypothetical protein
MRHPRTLLATIAAVATLAGPLGCGGDSDGPPSGEADADPGSPTDAAAGTPDAGPDVDDDAGPAEDLDMQAADFECILRWDKVNRFRITNRLGHLAETLAVANSATGGEYPVGTIIQLVPFEAMVKRRRGWNDASNDWEFFALTVNARGTTIAQRGTTDVVNQFNGTPCLDCHAGAAPQWDLVCEQDHGCEPLPIGPDVIERAQNSDQRCP